MHKYIKVNSPESKIYLILALASLIISLAIGIFLKHIAIKDFSSVIWALLSGMPIFIYGVLYKTFDKWLWKQPIINKIINVPDLNGTYKGKLRSSYNDFQNPMEFTLSINQTFSEISIRFRTKTSVSKSISAYLKLEKNEVLLIYNYHNEPNIISIDTLNEHKGTTWIRFYTNMNKFVGRYFTDKRPTKEKAICNYGEIEGKKID